MNESRESLLRRGMLRSKVGGEITGNGHQWPLSDRNGWDAQTWSGFYGKEGNIFLQENIKYGALLCVCEKKNRPKWYQRGNHWSTSRSLARFLSLCIYIFRSLLDTYNVKQTRHRNPASNTVCFVSSTQQTRLHRCISWLEARCSESLCSGYCTSRMPRLACPRW